MNWSGGRALHPDAKTVAESEVYLFAGITGDFIPNHINHEAMAKTVNDLNCRCSLIVRLAG